jgi:RsiW-degrading membrane proteinase PrsW (M82 family)
METLGQMAGAAPMTNATIAEQLAQLTKLRSDGAISEDEFARLKTTCLEREFAAGPVRSGPADPLSAANPRGAANLITNTLGLESITDFSLKKFFSEVFLKRSPDESEAYLSVGFANTTPPLSASMSIMPSPWLFSRVLLYSLLSYAIFYFAWNRFENLLLVPGLIMIGSFAVPLSVVILFFELNTPRNISIVRVVQMIIAGGAVSLLFSLFLYDATPLLGVLGAPSAGIIEECGKLASVCLFYEYLGKRRYPYILNGLLFGAAVGAGFAAFESAGYALRIAFTENSATAMLENIQVRGLLSPFAHIIWTAITAAIYWKRRELHDTALQTLSDRSFQIVFAAPVVLHAIWDMDFEVPFYGKYLVLGFIGWVVVISLIQSGLGEIAALTRPAALPGPVPIGQPVAEAG